MSLNANVPPDLPDLDTIPIAFVAAIHFCGDSVKAFVPDSLKNLSNSIGINCGLCAGCGARIVAAWGANSMGSRGQVVGIRG